MPSKACRPVWRIYTEQTLPFVSPTEVALLFCGEDFKDIQIFSSFSSRILSVTQEPVYYIGGHHPYIHTSPRCSRSCTRRTSCFPFAGIVQKYTKGKEQKAPPKNPLKSQCAGIRTLLRTRTEASGRERDRTVYAEEIIANKKKVGTKYRLRQATGEKIRATQTITKEGKKQEVRKTKRRHMRELILQSKTGKM